MTIFDAIGDVSRVLEGAARSDRQHREGSAGDVKQAAGAAFETGAMLLDLFSTLPRALAEAERAEHARLVERHGDDHALTREVRDSVAALEALEEGFSRGRARAARALTAAWQPTPGEAFHGFVTDGSGAPLAGLRVALTGVEGRTPEATTAADGYFAVPLPTREREKEQEERETAEATRKRRAAPDRTGTAAARVVITDPRGTTLHEDPIPLDIEAGSAYREYRLREHGGYEAPGVASPKVPPRRTRRSR